MSASLAKKYVIDSPQNVPPRHARALRSVLAFFDHPQIVDRVSATSRKWNDVIDLVLSGIVAIACFLFPFFNQSSADIAGNSSVSVCGTSSVRHQDAKHKDDPRGWPNPVVCNEYSVLDQSNSSRDEHVFQIVNRIVTPRPKGCQVENRNDNPNYPKNRIVRGALRWNGGVDLSEEVHVREGRFTAPKVSLSECMYVNGGTLAFV